MTLAGPGATIVHRVLTRLFRERRAAGPQVPTQLRWQPRLPQHAGAGAAGIEKISKTNAVTSQLDYELPAVSVHVGPSDHVPWLLHRKWCYIRMEGTTFGNVPLNAEVKLEVWDSPNSAGVVIDAIRCCKIALDRGLAGPLAGPSVYFMKSPPTQYPDDVAHDMVEEYIAG
jgi:myo-inositol-1-phosphate synthase